MKIVLLANQTVGHEILKFMLASHRSDLSLVVCMSDDEIYRLAKSNNIVSEICINNEELHTVLNDLDFDIGIMAWWPFILQTKNISKANYGFINTHNSLLPNNRGKHPYFWAIIEELPYGVTLHWVDEGIDTGAIISQKPINITWEDNSDTVYQRSQNEMISLFKSTYPMLRDKTADTVQQSSLGTFHYSTELEKMREIDLNKSYKARHLLNLLRATTSSSNKFKSSYFRDGNNVYRV